MHHHEAEFFYWRRANPEGLYEVKGLCCRWMYGICGEGVNCVEPFVKFHQKLKNTYYTLPSNMKANQFHKY